MRLNGHNAPGPGFTTLASVVLITAILYFGKEVFVPIALASLLSFLLMPLVVRLGRWGFGKAFSVLIVVTLAFSLIGVIGWLVTAQVLHLVDEFPRYQQNLHVKVLGLKRSPGTGLLSKGTAMLRRFRKEVESLSPKEEQGAKGPAGQETEPPLPVEVKKPMPGPLELAGELLGPVLKPMAMGGAVVFLVILMLFQREDLRERFLKLVSGGELNVATQAVDDATQRVSRYLLMQLVVNACYGIPIGAGLYLIGVPNAFLWGLLATLLRFVPFLGLWIAASFPLALAFAVDPGWTKLLLTLGLYAVVEVMCVNLVEPWLYGATTGASNIALLMAAVFWTWLWGPVGLLLSTPLTVCLLVLGKYVPGLNFLNVVLGSDPVLDPAARFYQRMLAMDEDELLLLSEQFIQERSLAELYDTVIVPALSLAEQDRHKGALAEVRQAFIVQNTRELIELLGERETDWDTKGERRGETSAPGPASVLCIPTRDDADELAALMVAQLLQRKGISAECLAVKMLASECSKHIRSNAVRAVCLSAIPPFAVTPARRLCRRLKVEFPQLQVIVGVWSPTAQPTEVANRLGPSCSDGIVTRLGDAVARLESLLSLNSSPRPILGGSSSASGDVTPPGPLPSSEPGEVFDSVTREAAKLLDVPVSLVSIIETDQEFWKAHGGLPPGLAGADGLRETSVCANGFGADGVLGVEDITADKRFASDPLLQERGIRFYAGVPLQTSDGHRLGTLCITDTEPHRIPDSAKAHLSALARKLIREVEHREFGA